MRLAHTEHELIALQKALITPGVHAIQASSLRQGRKQLLTLLASLGCYTNMACITRSASVIPQATNIYTHLTHAYAQIPGEYTLSCFIGERFYYDFLWIELTERLEKQTWFEPMVRELTEGALIEALPVVLLSL